MSVGRDISEHVRPPRTAFVNFPMGNTIGHPHRPSEQLAITRAALSALDQMHEPGVIVDLPFALEQTVADGRPWQQWVYTKEFRRALMKKRSGERYARQE